MINLQTVSDPYKNHRIPEDSEIVARLQNHIGRAASGRFTWQGTLSVMSDNDFPPDSLYWRRYALGAIDAIVKEISEENAFALLDAVFPDTTIQSFTWRTICEMLEVSLKLARAGERGIQKLANAAHGKLEELVQEKSKHEPL